MSILDVCMLLFLCLLYFGRAHVLNTLMLSLLDVVVVGCLTCLNEWPL